MKRKILIVSEDSVFLEGFRRFLRLRGHRGGDGQGENDESPSAAVEKGLDSDERRENNASRD